MNPDLETMAVTSGTNMSEAKHTPGPWDYWDMDEHGFHVFLASERRAGQHVDRSIAAVRYGRTGTNSEKYWEARANARLIAAAPDLLAMLISLRSENEIRGFLDPATDRKIDALIEKALGT